MQMVHDEENWEYYSAAIVKLQVEFVKKLPANVKDLIRLVKYWRKTYIPQSGSKHLPPPISVGTSNHTRLGKCKSSREIWREDWF